MRIGPMPTAQTGASEKELTIARLVSADCARRSARPTSTGRSTTGIQLVFCPVPSLRIYSDSQKRACEDWASAANWPP
jgi:hypothetical protein